MRGWEKQCGGGVFLLNSLKGEEWFGKSIMIAASDLGKVAKRGLHVVLRTEESMQMEAGLVTRAGLAQDLADCQEQDE